MIFGIRIILKGLFERILRFEEQIIFKDKCTSIFFVLKEAVLCLLSFKYFAMILFLLQKMFINSVLFAAFDVYFLVFSGMTLIYEQTKMSLLL